MLVCYYCVFFYLYVYPGKNKTGYQDSLEIVRRVYSFFNGFRGVVCAMHKSIGVLGGSSSK